MESQGFGGSSVRAWPITHPRGHDKYEMAFHYRSNTVSHAASFAGIQPFSFPHPFEIGQKQNSHLLIRPGRHVY